MNQVSAASGANHASAEGVADSSVPALLMAFQLTLRPPAGMSAARLLAQFDDYTNEGGPAGVEPVRQVPIREVSGWRVTADIYRPAGAGPFATLVWFHGGAWVMGSPWTHRRLAAELAALGLVTVVVDYRRAPKHRFPAAFDDAVHAIGWARQNAHGFGGDPGRLLVGGDSAGANLAAAALADRWAAEVRAALLCYGIYDVHRALPHLDGLIGGPEPATQQYLDPADAVALVDDPRLHPERYCDEYPPTLLLTGGRDPLAGESTSLAAALTDAGVPHELVVVPDAPHGLLQLPTHPAHQTGLHAIEDFLRRNGHLG